jgi:DNA-3-methyladenine glycosylase II
VNFQMQARGPFSLDSAVAFVEGFSAGQGAGDGRLDMAFPAEGGWSTLGVRVTGDLRAAVLANPGRLPAATIRAQVERILSLDVDGSGFPAVGERDPVVGELQERFPGLRPVSFYSPYEAAAWTIIGQRIRRTQAAAIKNRLAERFGDPVDFGDRTLPAFPAPATLAGLGEFPGLTDRKVDQLRSLGRAAADGLLDAADLRGRPVEEALTHLQELPGIGPFSAELILLRGAGHPDVFPVNEKLLQQAMATRYRLGPDPELSALAKIADGWRPYRTWVCLLLRAG